MNITDLSTLKGEKRRLQIEAELMTAALKSDAEMLKDAARPWALLHRAVTAIIPKILKETKITRVPINFLLKTIFGEKLKKKTENPPPADKKQQIKNVAMGLAETAAMFFLAKGIRKKF